MYWTNRKGNDGLRGIHEADTLPMSSELHEALKGRFMERQREGCFFATTGIYLHSMDESQLIAMEKIQGKFTPKNANPPHLPATQNNKEVNGEP